MRTKLLTAGLAALIVLLGTQPLAGASAEPVYPTDPQFPNQWNLHNTGQLAGTPDADIDAPEAWGRIRGRPLAPVSVAVLEDGVEIANPEFAGQLWVNPDEVLNGVDDDGNGYLDDIHGSWWPLRIGARSDDAPPDSHGSRVASVIAAAHNDLEIAGVAPNARLMVLSGGTGGVARGEQLGLEYALSEGARVVNISLGGSALTDEPNFCPVIAALSERALVVASAGNGALDSDQMPHWPSSCPGALSVTASDRSDVLWSYSNWGASSVDIAAPAGVPTICTAYGGCSLGGTSAAAPMVAGVAALLFGLHPGATPDDVRRAILESADPIGHLAGNQGRPTATNGRLNADRAIVRLDQIMAAKAGTASGAPPTPAAGEPSAPVAVPPTAAPLPRLTRARARAVVRASRSGTPRVRSALRTRPLRISLADATGDRRPEAIVSVALGPRRLWLVVSDRAGSPRIILRRVLARGTRLEVRRGRLWAVTPRSGRAPLVRAVALRRSSGQGRG